LTYLPGANGTISGTTPQTVRGGTSGTAVTAVPNTGYHFVNWSDGSTNNPRTDLLIWADKTVTANFAVNTYTLTYSAGAGGTISGTTPQNVNYNASGAPVTAVPNAGWHFVNWSDGSTANPRTDANVSANKSVTANFAADVSYTITASAGANGSITPSGVVTVGTGASQTFTITPDSGYQIASVTVDGVNQGAVGTYTFNAVTAPHTISAAFEARTGGTVSLTTNDYAWYDASVGSSGPWGTFSIYADGTLIGTKDANGTSTWNCPATTVSSGARIDIVENVGFNTLYGTFDYNVPITFTTYLPSGSTRLDAATWGGFPNISYGEDWYDGYESDYMGVYIPPSTITGIAYSTAASANYTLTYTAGPNGTLSGTTPQTVASGGSGTAVTAVPNANYHFVNWSDGSTANPRTDSNVFASKSVTANFAINTYTLTYTAGANGTISGTSPQTVAYNGSGTAVTAVANTGYHFVNWSDGSTANPRTDSPVTGNKAVTANFAINTYTLTYTAGANGTITGTSPQTVNHNGSGTAVTAVANAGYHFVNWSDGSTANPRTDSVVTGNKTVTANFAVNGPTTITASAGANGSITPAGAVAVAYNGSQTFAIAPNTGYKISQVLVDGVNQGAISSYTFNNVSLPHTISATFAIQKIQMFSYANTYGTISPSSWQYFDYGSTVNYTITPNAGYRVSALYVDYDGVNGWKTGATSYSFTNVTATHYLYAYFGPSTTRALIYTAGVGGSCSLTGPQDLPESPLPRHGCHSSQIPRRLLRPDTRDGRAAPPARRGRAQHHRRDETCAETRRPRPRYGGYSHKRLAQHARCPGPPSRRGRIHKEAQAIHASLRT
jgi:hypothetical protein